MAFVVVKDSVGIQIPNYYRFKVEGINQRYAFYFDTTVDGVIREGWIGGIL